jgi:hypothetical protein
MASHHLLTGGHAAQGHTFARQVEAIGETLGDVPFQVAAQYYPYRSLLHLGRLSRH